METLPTSVASTRTRTPSSPSPSPSRHKGDRSSSLIAPPPLVNLLRVLSQASRTVWTIEAERSSSISVPAAGKVGSTTGVKGVRVDPCPGEALEGSVTSARHVGHCSQHRVKRLPRSFTRPIKPKRGCDVESRDCFGVKQSKTVRIRGQDQKPDETRNSPAFATSVTTRRTRPCEIHDHKARS